MKILLYLEAEQILSRSGIGRAMKHQQRALDLMQVEWTQNPNEDYDILHLNTYGPQSWRMLKKPKSWKKLSSMDTLQRKTSEIHFSVLT